MANELVVDKVMGTIVADYRFVDGGIRKTGSLDYVVAAHDFNSSEDDIMANTAGLPVFGDLINGMWCVGGTARSSGVGKHPTNGNETRIWTVTLNFDSEYDSTRVDTNPLLRRVVVSRDIETQTHALLRDAVNGNPVVTAANEPIEGIPRPVSVVLHTLQRFEAYPFSDAAMLAYTNGVNNAPWRGAPTGTVWLRKISTREHVENNTVYENVTYQTATLIDPDNPTRTYTWKATVPHKGTWYKTPTGDFTNLDRYGTLTGKVFNLDSTGLVIPEGDPIEFIEFNRLRPITFPTGLG